ncbi:MAG: hypothetical protein JWO69_395, partial [Thermoleophilia bacterium]|nr:hypothetical protein [Thermoleophilia bacterium]
RSATSEQDVRAMASFGYHNLKGERDGQRAVKLTGNWRLIVRVDRQENGETVVLLDVVDYH